MEQALQEGQLVQGNGADSQTRTPLAVPIKVRGNVIGVLDTYKSTKDGVWTSEEIALLETLAEQLGVALESGRLYHEAQRRAARERLTREITEKMRRAADVESIVQTAVDELFSVLGTSRAFVRLGAIPPAEDNADIEPASVDIEPASVDIEPASVDIESASVDIEPASVSEPAPADSEPSSAEKSDER
jgi:GAF domain-containing protein